MAQIFRPSANVLAKLSIVLGLLCTIGFFVTWDLIQRSSLVRYTGVPHPQPVEYSHETHLALGIDCRYCHVFVEEQPIAGIPPVNVCMNCHSMIQTEAVTLEPVRKSWETGEPIAWTKVHDTPDFVFFDHSAHVNKGIGCATCHGRVDEMAVMSKENPLYMKWCLECHRAPEQFVRPRAEVFNLAYIAPANQAELGKQLVEEYEIKTDNHRLSDCWICHR